MFKKKMNYSSVFMNLMMMFAFAFTFVACSSDDENTANQSVVDYAKRLEFPRLQDASGNSLYVVLDEETNEVNYSVEYNRDKKAQYWSCWEMYKGNMRNADVKKYSPADSKLNYLPWGPLTSDFIKNSGYDHGHICPSADRLNKESQNKQTFFYFNMQPQIHKFNDGVWGAMEKQVRDLCFDYDKCTWNDNVDTLYVCRGGTIGAPVGTIKSPVREIKSNGLIVPNYYFCALLKKKGNSYEAIGLIFEHKTNSDTSIAKYCVSIDELEERTGFDFFCNLPDDVEKNVETECNPASFGFK